MTLKEKVVSLELTKQLKSADWEDCEFWWCNHFVIDERVWTIFPKCEIDNVNTFFPAPLPCEILERLQYKTDPEKLADMLIGLLDELKKKGEENARVQKRTRVFDK